MDERTQDLIEIAREQKFLFCPGADQETIFLYKKTMARLGLPAICLIESPRHVEIAVLLSGCALTERAKIHIAERFILASSPFSLVLCNDKRMICSMLTFDEGFYLVQWLVGQLANPANLKEGESKERNHDRIEARKRGDGSLWIIAGAAHLGREANKKRAA